MNKNIFCLSIGLCLCAGPYPVMAQKASSGPVPTTTSKHKQIEVKDYKSFNEYVSNEDAKRTTRPVTTDNSLFRNKMKAIGLDFSTTSRWSTTRNKKLTAYLSPDKRNVAVMDWTTKHVRIFDGKGGLLKNVPLSQYSDGVILFSDTRLFVIETGFRGCSGFKVFNHSDDLLWKNTEICVDGYAVSNTYKYFAVAGDSLQNGSQFALYDMDGHVLLKETTAIGRQIEIQFSTDDKFVLVKMPFYWLKGNDDLLKKQKAYLFDTETKQLIKEESYEK